MRAGKKLRHHFMRGLMRSAARLTYGQVQAALDGRAGRRDRIRCSTACWRRSMAATQALLAARIKRGTLDLDLPERRVMLVDGKIARIEPRSDSTATG